LDLPLINQDTESEPCGGVPTNILSAAQIVHFRLRRVFAGQFQSVVGFSFTAPTQYLGLLGIAEAMLYVLRLYDVVFHEQLQLISEQSSNDSSTAFELVAQNKDRIDYILRWLGGGYDSDPLLRALPNWMNMLQDAEAGVLSLSANRHGIALDRFDFCGTDLIEGSDIPQDLQSHLISRYTELQTDHVSREVLSSEKNIVLRNGLSMPVIGLGTWQLEGDLCIKVVLESIAVGYRY
jgi:hypothetical protein